MAECLKDQEEISLGMNTKDEIIISGTNQECRSVSDLVQWFSNIGISHNKDETNKIKKDDSRCRGEEGKVLTSLTTPAGRNRSPVDKSPSVSTENKISMESTVTDSSFDKSCSRPTCVLQQHSDATISTFNQFSDEESNHITAEPRKELPVDCQTQNSMAPFVAITTTTAPAKATDSASSATSTSSRHKRRRQRKTFVTDFDFESYMDKRVMIKLNGGRVVEGTLRGFDPFMNLVVDDGVEVRKTGDRVRIGVSVIRGSSIIMLEAMDRIS